MYTNLTALAAEAHRADLLTQAANRRRNHVEGTRRFVIFRKNLAA